MRLKFDMVKKGQCMQQRFNCNSLCDSNLLSDLETWHTSEKNDGSQKVQPSNYFKIRK